MYNKLFRKILDSSIWLESHATVRVWITFLAAMDQDGFCEFASAANLAHRARVTPEECVEALRVLEGPDLVSPGQDYEGRRVERVPGGWMVLNAAKYKDIVTTETQREQTRERVRRFRQRQRDGNGDGNGDVTPSETETEAQTEGSTSSAEDPAFATFWSAYPRRAGGNPRKDALKCWNARIREGHAADVILAGLDRYVSFIRATQREGTEFVMQAKRFIGPALPFLEKWDPPPSRNGKPNVGEQGYANARQAVV